jgi:putative endonuclease
MFYIYVLKSLRDNRTYVGYTNNLIQRIYKHKTGQVKSIKNRLPIKLLFSEEFPTAHEAKRRELWWKSGAGRRKLKEIYK